MRVLAVSAAFGERRYDTIASFLREVADTWMRDNYTPPKGYCLVPVPDASIQPTPDCEQAMRIGALHYLSGPMTGHPEFNYPAFHAAAAALRGAGINVVNPAEIAESSDDWANCMRADLKALCDCEAIVLMPGWETSAGAHLELHIAHRIGLRIVHLRDLLQPDPQPYDQGERAYVATMAATACTMLTG